MLNQRELDLVDCFSIRAAEIGYDALHHSMWWNVSQNVGRTEVVPRPGLTGCITPGGENFGPHLGRCILGYEKLLLGGIPVDKLQLGTETEVQLADLAGNAMVSRPHTSSPTKLLIPAFFATSSSPTITHSPLHPTSSPGDARRLSSHPCGYARARIRAPEGEGQKLHS